MNVQSPTESETIRKKIKFGVSKEECSNSFGAFQANILHAQCQITECFQIFICEKKTSALCEVVCGLVMLCGVEKGCVNQKSMNQYFRGIFSTHS